ncbi:MAG: FAD-dependent oxidoreductase [Clostridiales bacterium]|nr:FAD-dependent oxidoreductase [Clostridiales bacterium]
MSRLELFTPSAGQLIVEGLYKNLEQRIVASPPGLCPVDITRAFIELCHAQTCGKCVPCRVGLLQLKHMLTDVLNGTASPDCIDRIEETAYSIMQTADCAIGQEAAGMVWRVSRICRDDFESHIRSKRCTCTTSQPVPCVTLCPAHVDVPGYIALVREGRYADAIRLIRKDNPFPCTCGFICEHPCEARCRRNMVDTSVNIRGLKRVAADLAGKVAPPPCGPSTGKKIAVVGGGPSGLSSDYYQQLIGHQVTVYEMLPKLGGMLRYGIPNYRLPKDRLEEDIDAILETGVEVCYHVKVGVDVKLDDLRSQYDAVLITVGASTDKKLHLDGEDAPGVMSAVGFLRDISLGNIPDLSGQEVAVVGGGNVSMDAVRSAIRLGAKKVSIVYRRRVADMTALPAEVEAAEAEGVELLTLLAPTAIELGEDGHVCGLRVTPQMISTVRGGRASVHASGEPDRIIPCQTLIVAIGQNIETRHYEESGIPVSHGKIVTLPNGGFEGIPGVFAGGDCASGPATVIRAVAAAKVTAANIDEYLGFHHDITCDVEIPLPKVSDHVPCGRVELPEREAYVRKCDFEAVENCMGESEIAQESGRCLRCDHFGYGIFRGGREKIW